MDGLDLAGLVGRVSGFSRQPLIDFARACIVSEIVFGLFQIVIAAVAGRHDCLEAHLIRNREIAG